MENLPVEILLIEDNIDDAELTIHALKKKNLGNNLIHLKDGEEALEFLYATGKYAGRNLNLQPRMILLDLKMPKLNGMEVLEKVKTEPSTKKIPVVILTSSREDPDLRRCYELGANSYIVKPVDFESFVNAVAELGLYWIILNQIPGQENRGK
ncbi:MAG TPA: response regulator [Hanamia sp.]|jgi:Response regulators consisting of a CheY-like receiver domain and a winged-helix DNA-binding domain|nr:response regulator [Hanamia sp.]